MIACRKLHKPRRDMTARGPKEPRNLNCFLSLRVRWTVAFGIFANFPEDREHAGCFESALFTLCSFNLFQNFFIIKQRGGETTQTRAWRTEICKRVQTPKMQCIESL